MLRHLEWRGETMGKVDAAKAGDFLFRYMVARHKCKHMAEPPPPAARLADLIEQGKREFDEIYVEPEANVPIAGDDKHHDLFAAIIKRVTPDCASFNGIKARPTPRIKPVVGSAC